MTAGLPVGQRLQIPAGGIPDWEIFPYEGDIQPKILQPPVLPEPPRHGESGPQDCHTCQEPLHHAIWADQDWLVQGLGQPTALPAVVLLYPREHHDLTDLPARLAVQLGPMLQRVEQAIMSLGGIARVHVNRWGDGGAHLHLWLIARPAGMLQLRGSCLPLWEDLLPKLSADSYQANLATIAASLAAGGGQAYR